MACMECSEIHGRDALCSKKAVRISHDTFFGKQLYSHTILSYERLDASTISTVTSRATKISMVFSFFSGEMQYACQIKEVDFSTSFAFWGMSKFWHMPISFGNIDVFRHFDKKIAVLYRIDRRSLYFMLSFFA